MLLKREERPRPGIKVVRFVFLLLFIVSAFGGCYRGCDWFNKPPVAKFSANPTSGEAPLEVTFDASESYDPDGDEISYEWDFDDGNIAEGETVQHGFGSPGSYTVRLLVTDSKGTFDKSSKFISVSQPSDVTVKEQTFDAQEGIEYNSGTGLEVSIPPAPAREELRLVVTENPTPQQLEHSFIELLSVYDIALSHDSDTIAQHTLLKGGLETDSEMSLTFEIPPGVDPHTAMVLQWTNTGWSIPFSGDDLGGRIDNDGRHISISVPVALNPASLYVPKASIGQAWRRFCLSIGTNLDCSPTYPSIEEETQVNEGEHISKTLTACSSGSWYGGVWFRVWFTGENVVEKSWTLPHQGFSGYLQDVGADDLARLLGLAYAAHDPTSPKWFLPPTDSTSEGTLQMKFLNQLGSHGTVYFSAYDALKIQIIQWVLHFVPYADVTKDLVDSICNAVVESFESGHPSIKQIAKFAYSTAKILVKACAHFFGKTLIFAAVDFTALVQDIGAYVATVYFGNDDLYGYDVTIHIVNNPPVANAGSDQHVQVGTLVTLDGSASRAQGEDDGLTYHWVQAAGESQVALVTDVNDPRASFIPTKPGVYEFKLVVNDGKEDSDPAYVSVTVVGKPDLGVATVKLSKPSAKVGDTISLTLTVENKGGSTPGQFTYGVFLATTKWGTTVLADEFSWPGVLPLTPGLALEMEEEIAIPQVPDGDYYVTVYMDNKEQVSESDENNNIGSTYPNKISISSGPVKALDSVTISGPSPVSENSSADYTCTAHFSDGSDTNVTSQASWTENTSYTTISNGRLNVGSLSSDKTCTVSASYNYNGVTKTATKSVTLKNVPTPKTLNSVSISGDSSVDESTSANYTCTAYFSDGSNSNVTGSATWSENSSYTTISGGQLTVSSLSSDRSCTVSASYNYNGVTKTATKSVTLRNTTQPNQPPTCSLIATPQSGDAPLTVTFSISASDPDGNISSWLLDVDGDGTADYSGTGSPPSSRSYTYSSSGSYSALLAVSDNSGTSCFDVVSIDVDMPNQRPTCSLTASPRSGDAPLTVTFSMSASDSDGTVSPWILNFGDGSDTSGSGSPPTSRSHTYSAPGTYNAILMVSDDDDLTAADMETIVVSSAPGIQVGDRVRATQNLNVRRCADTSCLEISDPNYPGYAPTGTYGTVIDGPESADAYVWWEVQYDPGYSGWSVENGLEEF